MKIELKKKELEQKKKRQKINRNVLICLWHVQKSQTNKLALVYQQVVDV